MKSIICFIAVCLLAQGAMAISADIVFVVDESGSMGTVQANIRNNIGTFASILSAGGVDATYALVGYGDSAVRPRLITDFTNPGAFATAAQGLGTSGFTEPAYEAIMASLEGGPSALNLTYRAGAVKNVIIVTDEQSNGDLAGANWATADALLTGETALLNGILTTFSANTVSNGGTLAGLVGAHGGSVFSLSTFDTNDQNVIDAFVTDFANRKLQEIIDQGNIPEPGTLILLGGGLGLIGLVSVRRRRGRKAA
jgi:hypothetical protein